MTLLRALRVLAVGVFAVGAASATPAGPGQGGGERSVPAKTDKPTTKASSSKAKRKPTTHKVGRAPKEPAARLPKGAPTQPVDEQARRNIRGDADLGGRATDPQLSALREADRVLFPKPLIGFRPGWSWGDSDPTVQADGLPPVVQALPSATVSEAADAEWIRSLAMPDFPIRMHPRVVEYLRFYRDDKAGKAIAAVWARKVGRYTAAMQTELAKAGLPKDLVWLSLIESGHNPTIASPAGAAGLWQFIPDTARLYGLTVDRWVDERLDPQRSTQGAAAYLGDLYQRFGTWELAMAAYNMGHGGLMRAVRKYNTNDFHKLAQYEAGLPWETTLYVPKVFAIAIVMNNRRAFGLGDIELDPPVTFDTVYVRPGVALDDVAKASGIPIESLRSMNPQYQGARTPPAPKSEKGERRWALRVPRGKGAETAQKLGEGSPGRYAVYVLRFGDTLGSVAQRAGMQPQELGDINGLLAGTELPAGAVLLVPESAKLDAPDAEDVVVVPQDSRQVPGRMRVFYRVLGGDTLESIASRFGVTREELVVWNDLDGRAKLLSDMTLQVFVPKHAQLQDVRVVSPKQTRVLEVGTREFLDHAEALNGRKRILVTIKKGDTLAKVGRRYGLSVGMMERINRFPRTRELVPGERVIVYAKGKGESPHAESPKPLAKIEAPVPQALPDVGR